MKGFRERRDIVGRKEEARYIWDLSYRFQSCEPDASPGSPAMCVEP